jgi:putative ABC transport system permease protein
MSESIQVRTTNVATTSTGAPLPAGARVDAAHVLGSGPPATDALPTVSAAQESTDHAPAAAADALQAAQLMAHMRVQGRQLAQLLHGRQQELDRREALQHAQAAELETQMRAARVWLAARQQELTEREQHVASRERAVTEASSQLSAAEAYHAAAQRELVDDLRRREGDLDRGRAELQRNQARLEGQASLQQSAHRDLTERREQEHNRIVRARQQLDHDRAASLNVVRQGLAALEKRRAVIEQEAATVERRRAELAQIARRPSPEQIRMARASAELADHLATRAEQLATAERLQVAAEAELLAIRRGLEEEREKLAQFARTERQRLVESERKSKAELAAERDQLMLQRQQLDQRQAHLERLRAELAEVHQAALESRLVTEETLVQLAGAAATPDIARSLAETRARVADQWRLAAGRIASERAALSTMTSELAAKSQKLVAERDELSAWVERRQAEFDHRVSLLADREEELHNRERALDREREEWDQARLAFEQQLRNAATQLRESSDDRRASA